MVSNEQKVQVCDATGDDSSTPVCQKIIAIVQTRLRS